MTAAYTESTTADAFLEARQQAETMEHYMQSAECLASTHAEFETYLEREGREYERRLAQAHLHLRAAREKPAVVRGADGVRRSFLRPSARSLMLVFGVVEVPRTAYQAPEVDGLHPMDAVLNLPAELYSHGVRRRVAVEAAKSSFDETVEHLATTTAAPVPKRQVEELAVRAAQDFEAFYEGRALAAEETDDLLVLSFDGKGIAMRHDDLRPATKKAAETRPHRLKTRVSKGEKRNRKRMAEVAAIYTIAPWVRSSIDVLHSLRPLRDVTVVRPRPVAKRVWASVEQDPADVINAAFDEGLRRDPDRRRHWVVLVDGNKDQLKWVKKAAKRAQVRVTLVIDVIHVLEYLWKAAYCFFEDGTKEAEDWVQRRFHGLLLGRSGGDVAAVIRRRADDLGLEPEQRAAADDCADYLVKYTRLMHYDRALANGLPIATGVIEGACRYLVKDRMDRTGARWSLRGAEAVLRLRSLRTSGDFNAYWVFHLEQERRRNHVSLYADGAIPSPLPASRPRLRRVK
jgi:hypothetical protein